MKRPNNYLIFFICLSCSILVSANSNSILLDDQRIQEDYPRSSSFYNLTGIYMETNIYDNGDILVGDSNKIISPILIDDTLENHTWSYINSTFPWCSGSGTFEEPYVIENVYIDGQYMSNTYIHYSNIFIRHSSAYFIIKNCSLHKNGANERGCLLFHDTINGLILDNELTFNGNSIRLSESHNFTIKENYFESNHNQLIVGTGKAIYCAVGSSNNTIERNVIINHYDGIVAFDAINLNITHNYLNNTLFGHYPETGLYLVNTNYSSITYNTFCGDYADFLKEGESVISQHNCEGNTIADAFIVYDSLASSSIHTQQTNTWFLLSNSNYNYIYGNRIIKSNNNPTIGVNTMTFLFVGLAFISLIIILKRKAMKISNF